MRDLFLFLSLIALNIGHSCSLNSLQTECEQVSPCSCRYPSYSSLDLTNLAVSPVLPSNFSTTSNGSHIYFYHPCQDAPLNTSNAINAGVLWLFKADNISTSGSLDPNLALNKTYNGSFTLLATSGQSSFENTRITLNTASIKYINNTLVSKVILDCVGAGPNTLEIHAPIEPTVTHCLILRGPQACPNETPSTLSLGSTLLILFFTISSMYFVSGCLAKKFILGARGPELIPHLEFWTELPSLVKEGVIYAFTCGKSRPYESI